MWDKISKNMNLSVMSTENLTSNLYKGNTPSMILTSCLFRMGGSASLLSNHLSPIYQIIHTLRTHIAYDGRSYNCVFQQDDDQQQTGILPKEPTLLLIYLLHWCEHRAYHYDEIYIVESSKSSNLRFLTNIFSIKK